MGRNRKIAVVVDEKGRVTVPDWVFYRLLKMSGSRAKSIAGQKLAAKKQFQKLILEYIESTRPKK